MSDAGFSTPDKDARIAELEAALAAARADISARDILIDTLRVQIARLKRMQFGKSSEKLDTQIACFGKSRTVISLSRGQAFH